MAGVLHITTLGELNITIDGAPITGLASRKAEALLVYLACNPRAHARDVLADLLWDDLTLDRARGNLSVVLTSLRQRAGAYLTITRQTVALNQQAPYRLDAAEFSAVLSSLPAGPLDDRTIAYAERALSLYKGDFLHGFAVRDSAGFESWVLTEQERLRRVAIGTRERLMVAWRERGAHDAGIKQALALLHLDPFHEEAHRQLMMLLAAAGQRAEALAHYEEYRQMIGHELGIEPTPQITEAYHKIRQGDGAASAVQRHSGTVPPSLPAPQLRGTPFEPTSFVGRAAELAQIIERLADPHCRLLTLVGPGGVGKTRLALRAATRYVSNKSDGGAFVSLAAAGSAAQLIAAIATAVGFTFSGPSEPHTQLLNFLRSKQMLLVLDNMEHLIDDANIINDILAAAPGVSILVTSRARLHLRAEWLYDLGGLSYPLPDRTARAGNGASEPIEQYSAIQLFAQRAAMAQATFALDSASIPDVVRICQLVEGTPLAIELAAALTRAASCTEIARQIAANLDTLATTLRDVPDRHRSIRAVFEHSWRLLDPAERTALAQLAVFQGGFTIEAAATVVGADASMLEALAAKSLLRRRGTGRYEMHEVLRQFAREHLEDHPAAQTIRERHSTYYLALIAAREAALIGSTAREACEQISIDLDNLRLAWQWAAQQSNSAAIAHAAAGLARFYEVTGLFQEGLEAFARAAAHLRATLVAPTETLGQLLVLEARFNTRRGRYDQALSLIEEAYAIAGRLEAHRLAALAQTQWGETLIRQGQYSLARDHLAQARESAQAGQLAGLEADALLNLGLVALDQGDYSCSQAYQEQALQIYQAIGDWRGASRALGNLGNIAAMQGDIARAQAAFTQALERFRAIGDWRAESIALGNLGMLTLEQGRYAEALAYQKQALHGFSTVGDQYGERAALNNLGETAYALGDYDQACTWQHQALERARAIGDQRGESLTLCGLGRALLGLGDAAAARDYSQQALAIAQAIGDRATQAHAMFALGDSLVALEHFDEAHQAFGESLRLREEIGDTTRAAASLAGLAHTALARNEPAAARAYAERIMPVLESGAIQGITDPFVVYLRCYEVLEHLGDPRARRLLRTAWLLLQEHADRISDADLRRTFLENIPAHRAIRARCEV